jgi:hypothetical protein
MRDVLANPLDRSLSGNLLSFEVYRSRRLRYKLFMHWLDVQRFFLCHCRFCRTRSLHSGGRFYRMRLHNLRRWLFHHHHPSSGHRFGLWIPLHYRGHVHAYFRHL